MELLYILLITAVVLCILLALCICCFANSRYCHCIDFVYDGEDSEPIKSKTGTSTRELSRSEYYSNTTPILGSSKTVQQSDFTNNAHQYSPLLSHHTSSKPLDGEITKTTFYASPDSHTTVTETSYSTKKDLYPSNPFNNETTSYSTTRNVYPTEPYRQDTASYSTSRTEPSKNRKAVSTEMSYSSERAMPYQVTTTTSNVVPQTQYYSEDVGYQTRAPQYALRKSSSQTSLYENN